MEINTAEPVPYSSANSAIFLILCIIPIFGTVLFGAVDNTTWVLITVLWAFIILLWIAESWKAGGVVLSMQPLQVPLLCLLFISLVHLLPLGGSGDIEGLLPIPASGAISLDPFATRFFVSKLAVYIVFFAACLKFVNSEDRIKKVVVTVIIFGSIIAFFGILLRLANPDGIYGLRETPQAVPFGPFVNQHHFAALMQMTSGVTLGLLFGDWIKRDKKILLVIGFVLMSVAAILTSSRGGLLGLVSVVAFVVLFNVVSGRWSRVRRSEFSNAKLGRNIATAAAGAALVLVIIGVVLFVGGGESLMRGIGATQPHADFSSGRTHFWSIALKLFLENPVIGVGFEAFGVAYTRHDTWTGLFRVEQAHNEYLQILAEGGILGFACLVAFIYLLFRKSLRTIADGTGIAREASIGALAGCFGILIHSFFDFPLRTPSNGFFFLLLCSIAVFRNSSNRKANVL
jgi:O-antigen ligase